MGIDVFPFRGKSDQGRPWTVYGLNHARRARIKPIVSAMVKLACAIRHAASFLSNYHQPLFIRVGIDKQIMWYLLALIYASFRRSAFSERYCAVVLLLNRFATRLLHNYYIRYNANRRFDRIT